MLRNLVAATTFALVLAGCRCQPPPSANPTGEISIVYLEGDATKAGRDAVYDFGLVPMEKKVSLEMEIRNTGRGTLFLESLQRDTGDEAFTWDFEPRELRSGESVTYPVHFLSPPDTRPSVPHEAKLILRASNTDADAETGTITLRAVSVSGECELPATLDFGAVMKGDSFDIATRIKNTRPIDALAFIGDVTSNSGDDKAFAFTPDSPRGEVSLKAAQEKTITLRFSPTESKDYLARVTMRRLDGCPDKVVKLIGTGVDQVLTWAPNPLDLGYVTPGLQVTGDVRFSNLGLTPVALRELTTSTSDFKVPGATLDVPAATRDPNGALKPGEATVTVTFKPTLLGPRNARLDFKTSLPKQGSGIGTLKGYGGGPDIDVKPGTLNFGRVAFFPGSTSYVNRKLTIQNAGTRPTPPDSKANLHLGAGGTGTVYWDVRVKANEPGNTATVGELCVGAVVPATGACTGLPAMGTYDPAIGLEASGAKALLDVPVRITPASLGTKVWEVVVYSNDPDEPQFVVTVRAEALQVPPCDYEVSPLNLNFGLLTPPAYKDLSFTIKNRGQNAGDLCLISSLDLKAPTDVVFSLPAGPLSDQELQPGQSMTVAVRAWPQGMLPSTVQNVSGLVSFSISNPTKPEGAVSLNATIGASCLTISPSVLDFGTVQKDCNSATRTVTIYNTCTSAVTVNSFSMVAGAGEKAGSPNCPGTSDCPEFIAVSTAGIAPNTVLNPGAAPVTFSMKYHPINYGADNGAFLIKVTQNAMVVDYVVTLMGNGDTMGLNTDVYKQDSKPKADILLVIDNSCSMSDKQAALALNFGSFIKYATSAQVDYHIGVISTDEGDGGKLVGDASNPKVLTPTTPDVELKFAAKVALGISGSGLESHLAPAVMALTAPVITAENAGFLRNDAVLAVVVVSDADDQSAQSVSYYLNQLLNIKGAQHPELFTYNVVGPLLSSAPGGCSYDGPGGVPRSGSAATQTGGVLEEICTPNWSTSLEKVGKKAFGYRTNFNLNATPDLTAGKTIAVKIDGVALDPVDSRGATVWQYDSALNSVNFEPLFVPEPGKTLTLTYFVACIP